MPRPHKRSRIFASATDDGCKKVVLQKELSANAEQADEIVFHIYERFNK